MYRKNNNPFLVRVPRGSGTLQEWLSIQALLTVKQPRNSGIVGKFDSVPNEGAVRI